jgi:hypothetical protein
VWLGRDDLLGRAVALKRIGRLPGADRTDVARAEREARLSAQLQHPHVVAVFDVVADLDADEHWLVMEHVDGTSLGDLVRTRGALRPDEAGPLLWQAADALVAAHAAGITHRDVKPSNILVDRDGTVKLTDFGIARVTTDVALTQTGLMTGSPAYLAPEVASGARADEAADVWSLGATAYHLLAGRAPYDGGGNVLAVLHQIVEDDPPRLPDAGPLAPLLDATLVKDPARRWSMVQVRDFLPRPDREPVPLRVPAVAPVADDGHTRVLGTVPAPQAPPPDGPRRPSRGMLVGLAAAAALVLTAILYAVMAGGSGDGAASTRAPSAGASNASGPTRTGMEAFIRDYVRTVADDPDAAWSMLTPKFQRESGGLEHYRRFWDRATNGTVLSITADPARLSVSYQVHFDNWSNGPGPTVLDLAYEDGHYRIDGEHSRGFEPAGD